MSIADEIDQPRRKTHRGRRSKGKGPKPTDHMAQANQHLDNAKADPTPKGTAAHLFKALSSLKKAQKAEPDETPQAF